MHIALRGRQLRLRPTASPSASAMNEPQDQQQYERPDGCVDDRRNDARTEMDAESRQQPTADDGAYDSDNEVADEPKPASARDPAGQPSGNEANDQNYQETFV